MMSETLPSNMPSFPTNNSENLSQSQNAPAGCSVTENPNAKVSAPEGKKIVLLKRPTQQAAKVGPQHGAQAGHQSGQRGSPKLQQKTPANNLQTSPPAPQWNAPQNGPSTADLLTQSPQGSSGETTPNYEADITPEQRAQLGEIDSSTGLDGLLLAALKNPKDRLFLLKLDQDMECFINDAIRTRLEFPPMNSYQRLIVHRAADYFKISHVVDSSGKAVVLYKSSETRLPVLRFPDLLEQEEEKPEKAVKIMKRQPLHPMNTKRSPGDGSDSNSETERRILTIEEREAAYAKARARIFQDMDNKDAEGEQQQEEEQQQLSQQPQELLLALQQQQLPQLQHPPQLPLLLPQQLQQQPIQQQQSPQQHHVLQQAPPPQQHHQQAQQQSSQQDNGADTIASVIGTANGDSSNKSKASQSGSKNGKGGRQNQQQPQPQQPVKNQNNKNFGNKSNAGGKNRQQSQQSTRSQSIGYQADRTPYLPQKPTRLNTYPGGAAPIPQVFHYPRPYFPGTYETNGVPVMQQPPVMAPDMVGSPMANPYVGMLRDWAATMASHYAPRNAWGQEMFAVRQDMAGGPPPYSQQGGQAAFVPPGAMAPSDNSFVQSQNPKHINQYPPPPHYNAQGPGFSETSQYVASPLDVNANKPSSLRDGTSAPPSPLPQSTFDAGGQQQTMWNKPCNQWGQLSNADAATDSKPNERQQDQKRMHRGPQQSYAPTTNQQRDSSAVGTFGGPLQSAPDYTHAPNLHPFQMYTTIVPPPMPHMGPRRAGSSDYVRGYGVMPPMGFPPQHSANSPMYDVERRPPKSTELFDPNNPRSSSSAAVTSNNSPTQCVTPTLGQSTPSVPTTPSGTNVGPSSSAPTNSQSWPAGPLGGKASLPPNPHNNSRRKPNADSAANDGSMVRSLSVSSNSSQRSNQNQQNRGNTSSTNVKKKNSGLLFDYSQQAPYEGVKPSEANDPQKPSHILELYDFADSDGMDDVTLQDATIKRLPTSEGSSSKRFTVIAIFKTSREAKKALQTVKTSRFKLKTWEPVVTNASSVAGPSATPTSGSDRSPAASSPNSNPQKNNGDTCVSQAPLANASITLA